MIKVFIDGSAGTTGLNVYSRLKTRSDISLITLEEPLRKDSAARASAINQSDITFLCLPDDAAKEAVLLAEDSGAVIIDTSTAHRVSPDFVYGFAELSGSRSKIAASKRIANPGCHASGFIALIAPLIEAGALNPDADLSCFSVTGYSGGGKKMIKDYETPGNAQKLQSPGMYALSQSHKHLAEMTAVCSLKKPPLFCPIVAPYYSGMQVTVPICGEALNLSVQEIKEIYKSYYTGNVVRYAEKENTGFLYAGDFSGRDDMEISVLGNSDRLLLVSRFDNLGKGACGAAIQNMNIALGLPEDTGLILPEV